VGRELKEALEDSPLAASNFILLDEETAQGQLDQVGDEITSSSPLAWTPSSAWTSHFLRRRGPHPASTGATRSRAGSTVLDLSGALDQGDRRAGARSLAGIWKPRPSICLPPAVVPAHPAALALGLILQRLHQPRRCARPSPRCCFRPASGAAPPWTNCISKP